MEYYSAIKRNTIESIVMRWMNLEPITQTEVSQRKILISVNYSFLTSDLGFLIFENRKYN